MSKKIVSITPVDGVPNYMQAITAIKAVGLIPKSTSLLHITVKHDDRCAALVGGMCRCRPEIWMDGKCVAKTKIAKKAGD